MELDKLYKSPKQATDIYSIQVFKFEINVLRNIRKFSISQFVTWNSLNQILQNSIISPVNIKQRSEEKYKVCKYTNGWECIFSTDFS